MEKEFIPYEQALALKELGFDEPCFVYWVYNNIEITFSTSDNKSGWSMIGFKNNQMAKKAGLCTAPTFSQAFRWFRGKYNFYNQIHKGYSWEGIVRNSSNGDILWNDGTYNSAEEAELECLKKLIEISSSTTQQNINPQQLLIEVFTEECFEEANKIEISNISHYAGVSDTKDVINKKKLEWLKKLNVNNLK